jgi:TatD DNase family protein
VVIHCRGAFSQLVGIVKKIGMPKRGGIIHAFKGSVEIVEQLIPLGFYSPLDAVLSLDKVQKEKKYWKGYLNEYW